jgi:GNAT superfamily N-acetyltransferase
MAALTSQPPVEVRAANEGEGRAIARLWRELWEAHEGWGGYTATRDDRAYVRLGSRLDEDARIRGGHPVLGRHVHLVATAGGEIAAQVEGWLERQGADAETPLTCEVRSLIVSRRARKLGLARALLEALGAHAREFAQGASVLLAAEVLEPNPAHAFYERLGFRPVSWTTRIATDLRALRPSAPSPRARVVARTATADDAVPIALLETVLAGRRRRAKDHRFDRPRALDATIASAIAAHLGRRQRSPNEPVEIVATANDQVRGNGCFVTSWLDYPFAPARRALLGRMAVDPAATDPSPLVEPLVLHAARLAAEQEAAWMEITDLDAPGHPLYAATLALGAKPWSRIVVKPVA